MSTAVGTTRKKRKSISLDKKVEIIKIKDNGKITDDQIASEFGLDRSTVSSIIRRKKEILESYNKAPEIMMKRTKVQNGKFHLVEEALYNWFSSMHENNFPISQTILKQKAKYFHNEFLSKGMNIDKNFEASNGWLFGFQSRFGIKIKKIVGENKSANMALVEKARASLKQFPDASAALPPSLHDPTGSGNLFFLTQSSSCLKADDCSKSDESTEPEDLMEPVRPREPTECSENASSSVLAKFPESGHHRGGVDYHAKPADLIGFTPLATPFGMGPACNSGSSIGSGPTVAQNDRDGKTSDDQETKLGRSHAYSYHLDHIDPFDSLDIAEPTSGDNPCLRGLSALSKRNVLVE